MSIESKMRDFDRFLEMLDEDRHIAAEKYLALRRRLEKFFEWRDCENTEELTDIVFDRVTKKILEGEDVLNPEAYSVTVAKFVLLENRREKFRDKELDENSSEINTNVEKAEPNVELTRKKFGCLDKCLAELPKDKRELIVSYFDTDEKTMISARKKLAEKIGTNLNTLRIRISRIKASLEICTRNCLNDE